VPGYPAGGGARPPRARGAPDERAALDAGYAFVPTFTGTLIAFLHAQLVYAETIGAGVPPRLTWFYPETMTLWAAQAALPVVPPVGPGSDNIVPAVDDAQGGVVVTITGSDFLTVVNVTFGGVDATDLAILDATHLSCRVPPHHSGLVDVTVYREA
jgi:IPT/TIG domain